jgi:RNA polymerase sigma-70 factor (ECF subfamily)
MASPKRRAPSAADPFALLVEAYTPLVWRVACRVGLPKRDIPDLVQEVFINLHEATRRGLDITEPLTRWLSTVAYRMARNAKLLARNARELVTASGDVDLATDPTQEKHMHTLDLHALVEEVLDAMPDDLRHVLTMKDMDDMSIHDIADVMGIPVGTAYGYHAKARKMFERIWNERRAGDDAAIAPFALWTAGDLIAAERSIPEPPPGFREEIMRGLAQKLGPGVMGAAAGAAGAGAAVAATSAAKAGVSLTVGEIVVGLVLAAIVGAALYAALAPRAPSDSMLTVLPEQRAALAVSASSSSMALAPPTPSASASAAPVASGSASEDGERILLVSARRALDLGNRARALELLSRIKSPRFAAARDELREQALDDAGP